MVLVNKDTQQVYHQQYEPREILLQPITSSQHILTRKGGPSIFDIDAASYGGCSKSGALRKFDRDVWENCRFSISWLVFRSVLEEEVLRRTVPTAKRIAELRGLGC